MHPCRTPTRIFAILFLTAISSTATVVFTGAGSATEVSGTELAYNADVSTSDLINGLASIATAGTAWNTGNGATLQELNDGVYGGSGLNNGNIAGAWSASGSIAEYRLSSIAAPFGFDITSIQSIAAWVGGTLGNQRYKIEVKPVGGSYATLATVDFQPLTAGGATKVTMTGLNATGIESIKFTANAASVWRELDIFGTATISPVDATAPTVISRTPANQSQDVLPNRRLFLTFDENIILGTGNITIKDLDTPSETVIPVNDPKVSVSGGVLTIDSRAILNVSKRYAVQIAPTAIRDTAGNSFGGYNSSGWIFQTGRKPLRIMPMGDSITVGYTNPDWSGGAWESGYRSGLYTRLANAGYRFQFVGNSTEPETFRNPETTDPAYPPALDLKNLGQEAHNGYGGKTASFLNSNILNWLADDDPDIILLKIGTNAQDQTGLDTLVNTITTTKPDLRLIIAQIMPKFTYQQGIVNYNSWIRDTLVPYYKKLGRNITFVDQYAPFLTNPSDLTSIDQSLFSNANNHPGNNGYNKMAQVWFEGIEALGLFSGNDFSTWISAFNVGGLSAFGDDPDGDGIANGLENFFGTAPDVVNPGLSVIGFNTGSGNILTFKHPQSAGSASDISAATYNWSSDLVAFHPNGTAHGGTTVNFAATENNPEPGITTVTATITGTVPDRLFMNISVTRTP